MAPSPSAPKERGDAPTALQRLELPFELQDELVEPFADLIVLHVHFASAVSAAALRALQQVLDEWLAQQRRVSGATADQPTGEVVQVGTHSVELHIEQAQGDPDAAMPSLLRRLGEVARSDPILRVEMD